MLSSPLSHGCTRTLAIITGGGTDQSTEHSRQIPTSPPSSESEADPSGASAAALSAKSTPRLSSGVSRLVLKNGASLPHELTAKFALCTGGVPSDRPDEGYWTRQGCALRGGGTNQAEVSRLILDLKCTASPASVCRAHSQQLHAAPVRQVAKKSTKVKTISVYFCFL